MTKLRMYILPKLTQVNGKWSRKGEMIRVPGASFKTPGDAARAMAELVRSLHNDKDLRNKYSSDNPPLRFYQGLLVRDSNPKVTEERIERIRSGQSEASRGVIKFTVTIFHEGHRTDSDVYHVDFYRVYQDKLVLSVSLDFNDDTNGRSKLRLMRKGKEIGSLQSI